MHHLRTGLASALFTVLVSLAATPAHAAPTAKDKADARQLVNDAKKATKEKNYAEAVKLLFKADELDPSPQLELDLAKALIADGKLVGATKVLRVLADPESKTTPKPLRDQAKKTLNEIEAKIPFLQVVVVGPADGKGLTRIDGVETDASVEAPVDPGEHKIEVTADGFDPGTTTVKLAEGKHEKVSVTLTRKVVAKQEESKGSLLPGIITISAGGAVVVVGAVFGGLAFSAAAAAKDNCKGTNCSPKAQDDIDTSKTFGNVSTAMFVIGGAAVAAGVVLLIIQPGGGSKKPEPAKAGLTVTPWIGLGQAGAVGTF